MALNHIEIAQTRIEILDEEFILDPRQTNFILENGREMNFNYTLVINQKEDLHF